MEEYEQLIDGEGVMLKSNEPFKFKCCQCGLVHAIIIATEEDIGIGFAVKVIDGE